MRLLTRETDYAVVALCFICAHEGELIPVSELTRRLKIPRPFLRKILQVMTNEGLLISHKGKGGGFKLGLDLDKIYLFDLIRIFQGSFKIHNCLRKMQICPEIESCRLKKKLDAIEKNVISKLKTISIESLLDKRR